MKRAARYVCAGAGLFLSLSSAQALVCTVSTTGVVFGAYSFFTPWPRLSTGSVSIGCDAVAAYSIAMNGGYTGTFARLMTSGANRLTYNLYTDATRTVVWGDGTGGSMRVSSSGTTGATHTVYGRIPALQNVPAGSYSDLLIVTVEF